LYEYRCEDCGQRFEVLQRLGAGADGVSCPQCGSERLGKLFSTFSGTVSGGSSGPAFGGGCAGGAPG
jgi:putative FmdB family regulatory protein